MAKLVEQYVLEESLGEDPYGCTTIVSTV